MEPVKPSPWARSSSCTYILLMQRRRLTISSHKPIFQKVRREIVNQFTAKHVRTIYVV